MSELKIFVVPVADFGKEKEKEKAGSVEWMIEKATKLFDETWTKHESTCIVTYTDNGDYGSADWTAVIAALQAYVKQKGYMELYDFWTDGCNYADEDYIKMQLKGLPRGGFCWASECWT